MILVNCNSLTFNELSSGILLKKVSSKYLKPENPKLTPSVFCQKSLENTCFQGFFDKNTEGVF